MFGPVGFIISICVALLLIIVIIGQLLWRWLFSSCVFNFNTSTFSHGVDLFIPSAIVPYARCISIKAMD